MSSAYPHRNAGAYPKLIAERGEPSWVFPAIAASSLFFIFLLLLAMVFDPSIRVLHPFQALIYAAIIYLARRHSAWGFGAGCIIGVFWNYIFLTGAARDIWAYLTGRTGGLFIPLQLTGVVAHLVLIAACVAGFRCLHPSGKGWAAFFGGGTIAVTILLALVHFLRPQSMILIRKSFGL